jgi:hypothetical protein
MRDEIITGKTYLELGQPVVVLVRWGLGGGPRNVLIRRATGLRCLQGQAGGTSRLPVTQENKKDKQ